MLVISIYLVLALFFGCVVSQLYVATNKVLVFDKNIMGPQNMGKTNKRAVEFKQYTFDFNIARLLNWSY